ncbi:MULTISPECIES: threonine--tRNA ligase [unclassified Microcystis]|jgi:threonyl-tRNA synthetase|uniref:Threonine--tRNA ligase n=1 Tax=Microcystis aeruginosa Ma_QC_Ca_00000000_S207 TaxID=2486251 RepID=A0A552G158_MICAE|nr:MULTISPECIES: threonine--tRNA ligase [unclassified Microcystis]MCA2928535.1 threonine--tRNA ligase [Microcystis sp. M020S1]MCA2936087.1 threonine--tRNA ligase [Microcystis sp. M015S1]MCU7243844.1 threonine--tRNA ligase [Microcystis aeruginosa WS75]NCQ67749.1 threonine--tRNA ligase [Microcystis aeruginosa W13-16]NCQ72232.1 threonine--tRNA ligase [Microcystis aeruginosa W13-13]NCQ76689.1 threonine--tRNA ligase [Microcystis aeruginosa W13-15]NCR20441.1 threonine--tRNA ligase [Microcystis aer
MDNQAPIKLPKTSESDHLKRIRHTTSHVMAMAVQKLFPKAQVTIGPWTETGFYYDFDVPEPFTDKDLKDIKKEMVKIINKKLPVMREEVSREEAEKRIKAINEAYKLEILAGIQEPITLYHLGDAWWDLCAGPHLDNTSELDPKAIELETVAGAYWRGDENKAQLQRIYGTAWENPQQLAEYKRRKQEALKRDHRKLGKELGLFIFSDSVGPGLPLWTPKGTLIRSLLEDFLKKEQLKRGYLPVVTPHIARVDLFKISGHWQKYKEDMFPMMADDEESASKEIGFVLKPMNCPFHIQIYKSDLRSYRELPMRLAEFGTVYRYEQSGELGGLTRVRGFTVDDSHLFVTPEQLDKEFLSVVDLILTVFKSLQLKNFKARLSFRDPESDKYIGSDEAWEKAESAIRKAVQTLGMDYFEAPGEAAFYGPKLDFIFQDALEREWQLGTVQVDYNLPERFELEYVAEDGNRKRPVMIHRAPFGSLERLIGILIEEYAGDFPLWLAPVQIRLLPVSDSQLDYAKEVTAKMQLLGIRAETDTSGERLGKMIRNAETEKIPVMAVVGAKEMETNSLSIRTRATGDLGVISVEEVVAKLENAIQNHGNF